MPQEPGKTLQVERVPQINEAEAWVNFNKELNDLANQRYQILHATNTYILEKCSRHK